MKPHRVAYSPRATRQLAELYRYIAANGGERRAETFVGKLRSYCDGLHVFPERGTQRNDIVEGVRILGYRRRAAIAFSVEGETVVIHGVFYGGQDYEATLRHQDEA